MGQTDICFGDVSRPDHGQRGLTPFNAILMPGRKLRSDRVFKEVSVSTIGE